MSAQEQNSESKKQKTEDRVSWLSAESIIAELKPNNPGDVEPIDWSGVFESVRRMSQIGYELYRGTPKEDLLRMGYTQDEIDASEPEEPSHIREARDWAEVNNLIVGAEFPPIPDET